MFTKFLAVSSQCVQKLEHVESPDIKVQDPAPRPPAAAPDSLPGARRAKRMKCEVGATHTPQASTYPTSVFLCIHVFVQAACVKTEPGEVGDSKPNLRRRMGSFVAKPEPGQAPPTRGKHQKL